MLDHLGIKCAINMRSEPFITCTCNIYNVGMICRVQTIIFRSSSEVIRNHFFRGGCANHKKFSRYSMGLLLKINLHHQQKCDFGRGGALNFGGAVFIVRVLLGVVECVVLLTMHFRCAHVHFFSWFTPSLMKWSLCC